MKNFLLLVALFTVAHGLAINKRQVEQLEEISETETPEQSPDEAKPSDGEDNDDELKSNMFMSMMQQFDNEETDVDLFQQILSYLDSKPASYKQ